MTVRLLGPLAALALAHPMVAQDAPSRSPDVHFVPTPMAVVTAMLAVAKVGPDDIVYDLGSGDGRIVITAASRRGARGIGIDIDPERIKESRINADSAKVNDRVTFRRADLFETDLRKASVVTLYLLPLLNVRLRPKLYRELRPGTRIVSNAFDMGDWKADSVLEVPGEIGGTHMVYYWVLPADLSGEWTVTPEGGKPIQLSLEQRFQQFTGRAVLDGGEVALDTTRIVGDSVRFTLREPGSSRARVLRFAGRASGDRASGTVAETGGGERKWSAVRKGRGRGPLPPEDSR